MIINSQRTIYGLEVQTATMTGVVHTPRINTTLNEKYNVNASELIGVDTTYSIKAMAIGVGASNAVNSTGYTHSQHSPLDAALFEQIPYIMRPVLNDLPPSEQAKYRLKVMVAINGTDYYQYFLKVISPTDMLRGTFRVVLTSGVGNNLVELTTNTSSHLNPVPLSNNRTFAASNEYINSSVKVKFILTPQELSEVNSAIDIIYGANSGKAITEIGICGGLNKTIAGVDELIHTQIYYHVGVNISLQLSYDPVIGYLKAIEIGGSEVIYA